ncbi:MAG: NAD(P)H-hydrate epimerase, partial [Candidatus Dormibacteria bacterium]
DSAASGPGLARSAGAAGADVRTVEAGDPAIQASADWVLEDVDLIVDSLLGTGAAGAPRGEVATLIRRINRSSAVVLAVDLPSGLDADSGIAEGDCVRAHHTLMLGVPRLGCEQLGARHWVGRLWMADIGIPRSCYLECGLEPPPGLGPDPV